MIRKKISTLARVRIFGVGVCCLCSVPIDKTKDKWIVEHIKPLWLGGLDDETNMGPAHYRCAIKKTCGEATIRAKNDRVRAKHLGAKSPKGRPIMGSKRSGFRRKMNGTWEKRDE